MSHQSTQILVLFSVFSSLVLAGCVGEATSGIQTIKLSGAVIHEDGSPAEPQQIDFSVIFTGDELFSTSESCDTHNGAKQGLYEQSIVVARGAQYAINLSMSDIQGADDSACRADSASFEQVQAIKIQVAIPATYTNCGPFCRAHSPSAQSSCLAECTTGGRSIIASKLVTQSALAAMVSDPTAPVIDLSGVKLVLERYTAPITSSKGADLQVSGLAVAESIRFSNESFSAASCAVQEQCLRGTGLRRLLRFDGVLLNLGSEDFVLGSPVANPLFELSACHGHYHLKEAMRYELLSEDGSAPIIIDGDAVVGRKQGFCMIDMQRVTGSKIRQFDCSYQGLTSGWADIYHGGLDCQWLDITGVPAGNYALRITVNPNGTLQETDKTNNSATVPVFIPSN